MTLATAILFVSVFSVMSANDCPLAQSAPQSSPSEPSSSTSVSQSPEVQSPPQATNSESAQPAKTSTAAQSGHRKKTHQKKKTAPADCAPAPASTTTAGSETGVATPQSGSAQAAQIGAATETPKPCPPQKIVVRKGGITEQSIQLAGGSGGDQATQKRNAANKMLAVTEGNLKQITGRQLSTAQHDSISQIKQFVDQSKSALASGDLERAQTLAWKAQLLSEDLIKPQE